MSMHLYFLQINKNIKDIFLRYACLKKWGDLVPVKILQLENNVEHKLVTWGWECVLEEIITIDATHLEAPWEQVDTLHHMAHFLVFLLCKVQNVFYPWVYQLKEICTNLTVPPKI